MGSVFQCFDAVFYGLFRLNSPDLENSQQYELGDFDSVLGQSKPKNRNNQPHSLPSPKCFGFAGKRGFTSVAAAHGRTTGGAMFFFPLWTKTE